MSTMENSIERSRQRRRHRFLKGLLAFSLAMTAFSFYLAVVDGGILIDSSLLFVLGTYLGGSVFVTLKDEDAFG